jgi:hypothetical protein
MTKPASIFDIDVEDEIPQARPSVDEIRAATQGTAFRSREATQPLIQAPLKRGGYRYRTGRTQFNVKVKPEAQAKIEAWSLRLNRPKGELLERAIALLEAELEREAGQ